MLMAVAQPRRHGGRMARRTNDAVAVVAATLWACLANAAAASNATATQCDAGWKYLPQVDGAAARCYVLSSTADSRSNASAGCRGRGGAELLALRTRASVTSALTLFAVNGGAATSTVVSLLDYAVYANGTVVDHNGALVADCSVCANVSLAPGRAQPACLVAVLAIGGAAASGAFVQDVDCSQAHTYLCSKPPTSGASTLDVRDSMAIFCTVFILVNFIIFNGYFLLSDYLKNHPHHGPVSKASAPIDGADRSADGGSQDTKKEPVSGGDSPKWRSEQITPHKLHQLQQQEALLHTVTDAASRSSATVRPPPPGSSYGASFSKEVVIIAPATSLPVHSMATDEQTSAIAAADDYAEPAAVAAAAVGEEAEVTLNRLSTPHYQPPPSSGTSDIDRSLASANVSETAAGLVSSGGEIFVTRPLSNRTSYSTDRSNDGRESRTSHQSHLPQDGCGVDDPVTVSIGEETSAAQRIVAPTGAPGRALSAASAQHRQTPSQQPAKLTRTFSRSAEHLR